MGIYLEHCFYRQSYITGDFSTKQARLVTVWLEDLLNEKMKLPKSLHQQNLWNELQQVFDNPRHLITRFWFLSVRRAADNIRFLLAQDKKKPMIFCWIKSAPSHRFTNGV